MISEFRTGAAFLKFSVGSDVMLRVKRRESPFVREAGWYRGYASSLLCKGRGFFYVIGNSVGISYYIKSPTGQDHTAAER